MRLLLQHESLYSYPTPASLGPHELRLRPAQHARARIESYSLTVTEPGELRWLQDPFGNHVARLAFRKGTRLPELRLLVEMAVDIRPVNPFDFFVDDRCQEVPFAYPEEMRADLAPFLGADEPALAGGPLLVDFLASLPRDGNTVSLVVELNRLVKERVRYVVREEAGIWTPEETLREGRGSCRDSAVLLMAVLRSRGLASRFASGYLVQLTDEGMLPDEPRGMGRDVVDLHAWAEVFLPGAGWIGLDATSGLLTGEGHIPLACVARPALGSPVTGTSDVPASQVSFSMRVGRLGHEPRPTAPYTDACWADLLAAGDRADEALAAERLTLTVGGEPTFNSREHPEAAEWNGDALGPTKWSQGMRLAEELQARLCPGGVILARTGKAYPGEPLPRWALDVVGRSDGKPLWAERGGTVRRPTLEAARDLAFRLAGSLGVESAVHPAYEDPWHFARAEAGLPAGLDPLEDTDLGDPAERQRLARVLDHGLRREVGYVLPLGREAGRWRTDRWRFRRGHLFLLPGDGPVGLRLPLAALGGPPPAPEVEPPIAPPDPRLEELRKARERAQAAADARARQERIDAAETAPPYVSAVRTALVVEPRGEELFVFVPPLPSAEDFFALAAAVGDARADLPVRLEGYAPRWDPELFRITVTPDPGVLEVNLPPTRTSREHHDLMAAVFDAALHAGLHAEKYLLDGRMAGSGGGNHLTLGGPTALESPFVVRPDVLASLVTFFQHHPSLSFLFTGLFVGPTSQAPRIDEARHDTLYELEIALGRAFDRSQPAPPWLGDLLFRHLLTDVAGNTHRAEICIDKLFDWRTPHGRQGLVELRAFEMPPHPRMAEAQMVLVRALVAAFAREPYRHGLTRWGAELHDRFLLPTWLWRDFEEVLAFLAGRGLPLPADAYRPFVELRCPVAGRIQAGGVALEVRNAIEPWPVLGEEPSGGGTSRYVDSSMERLELRAEGLTPERYEVLVNGLTLPLRPTGAGDERVGGVRFRAWCPPHSLHAHIGIHHPVRFDLWDRWGRRAVAAGAYHVWHPEGRAFEAAPLTRFEAQARRAQRFTAEGPLPWPVVPRAARPHPDQPCTLDLRRFTGDRPMPEPEEEV